MELFAGAWVPDLDDPACAAPAHWLTAQYRRGRALGPVELAVADPHRGLLAGCSWKPRAMRLRAMRIVLALMSAADLAGAIVLGIALTQAAPPVRTPELHRTIITAPVPGVRRATVTAPCHPLGLAPRPLMLGHQRMCRS
jgi:hypothetical protein